MYLHKNDHSSKSATLCAYICCVVLARTHLGNAVPFRNALKKAQITGSCYAFSHAFVYLAYAAGFRLGAYLIQVGRMTPEGLFM